MLTRRFAAVALTLGAGAAVAACAGGDRSLLFAPLVTDTRVAYGAAGDSGAPVRPLLHERRLAHDVRWSFRVGPEGREVHNGQLGLTIRVPRGAVSDTLTISVTSLAGDALGYTFEPHGTRFAVPLDISQSLTSLRRQASVQELSLVAGYFRGASLALDGHGVLRAAELLPVHAEMHGRTVRFQVVHFSGYTVASAVHGNGDDSQGNHGLGTELLP